MATLKPQWEILPDETDNAYATFQCYLELGGTRSIRKAQAAFEKKQTGNKRAIKASSGRANTWATKYRWAERARAYDDHMARETHAAVIKGVADRLKQYNDAALGVQLLILNKIRETIVAYKGSLPINVVAPLLSAQDKIARLALGDATDRTDHSGTITLEKVDAIRADIERRLSAQSAQDAAPPAASVH